jgi:hypothetical protein
MVVSWSADDKIGVCSPRRPLSPSGAFIERLWETEGSSAVEEAFNEKERKRKREAQECAAHGHRHLRHDGHFAPTHPPRRAKWCGDSVAKDPSSLGVTTGGGGDGDLEEEYCGLRYFGGKEGARSFSGGGCPMAQAECFNSSFNLLSIAPREYSFHTSFMISSSYEIIKLVPDERLSNMPCITRVLFRYQSKR